MLTISMPKTFTVGATETVRINGEPARLTWRDPGHLVVNDTAVHPIVYMNESGALIDFACGEAGEARTDYAIERVPGGDVVHRKR